MNDLIALIQRELRLGPVGIDTPLLSSGIVDSLHVAQLLTLLESEYGVRIPLAAVGVDNFDTPRQMYGFIARGALPT